MIPCFIFERLLSFGFIFQICYPSPAAGIINASAPGPAGGVYFYLVADTPAVTSGTWEDGKAPVEGSKRARYSMPNTLVTMPHPAPDARLRQNPRPC